MADDTLPLFPHVRLSTKRPPRLGICGHCRQVFRRRKGTAPHLYCSGACYHAAQTMTPEEKFWKYTDLNLSIQTQAFWMEILGTVSPGPVPDPCDKAGALRPPSIAVCFSRLRYMFYGHPSGVQPAPCI